jgi:hypothetical protein
MSSETVENKRKKGKGSYAVITLLDGSNVRLNWNIESDMNVNWIKFNIFLSLY